MVVGAVLFGLGKLQQLRNVPPVVSPTHPAATLDPSTATVQPNVLSSRPSSSSKPPDGT
jgi:hypothetical protein